MSITDQELFEQIMADDMLADNEPGTDTDGTTDKNHKTDYKANDDGNETVVEGVPAEDEPKRDRGGGHGDPQAVVANYVLRDAGPKTDKKVMMKRPITAIAEEIQRATSGIMSLDGQLFAHMRDTDRIVWLDKATKLEAWIEGGCPGRVRWTGKQVIAKTLDDRVTPVSWSNVLEHLRMTAPRFEAVEDMPHYPPRAGVYYVRHAADYDVAGADGSTLEAFVDLFNPDTPQDRDLIKAMIVTPMWGGAYDKQPAFVLTSDYGRGVGKTSTVKAVGKLYGGIFKTKKGESVDKFEKRLGSPGSETDRLILVDNVKGRTDVALWDTMITEDELDVYRNYAGRVKIANNKVWHFTLNTAELSNDLAGRSVVIKIGKGQHGRNFEAEVEEFLAAHRDALVADILAFLGGPDQCDIPKTETTRWQAWEWMVLGKMPNGRALVPLCEDRRAGVDVEGEEAQDIYDELAEALRLAGFNPKQNTVLIPTSTVVDVVQRAWGTRYHRNQDMWSDLRPLLKHPILQHCDKHRHRSKGRGLRWGRGGELFGWNDAPQGAIDFGFGLSTDEAEALIAEAEADNN